MTTVGYGETTPITNMGKTIVLIWLFIGLGFYCLFTGSLAAYLTNSAKVRKQYGWSDLVEGKFGLRVATVGGGSYVRQLEAKGITATHTDFADEQSMYGPLSRGEIDVVIADWPIIYGDMRRGGA